MQLSFLLKKSGFLGLFKNKNAPIHPKVLGILILNVFTLSATWFYSSSLLKEWWVYCPCFVVEASLSHQLISE